MEIVTVARRRQELELTPDLFREPAVNEVNDSVGKSE